METIYDAAGDVVATIVPMGNGFTNVHDSRGNPLGYSTDMGTYATDGRMVSPSSAQYGLLLSAPRS
jgi:hypothetical protein